MEGAKNTDREIWREVKGDYYSPSIHVTEDGKIGIKVAGKVLVLPAREWFRRSLRLDEVAKNTLVWTELYEYEGEPGEDVDDRCIGWVAGGALHGVYHIDLEWKLEHGPNMLGQYQGPNEAFKAAQAHFDEHHGKGE